MRSFQSKQAILLLGLCLISTGLMASDSARADCNDGLVEVQINMFDSFGNGTTGEGDLSQNGIFVDTWGSVQVYGGTMGTYCLEPNSNYTFRYDLSGEDNSWHYSYLFVIPDTNYEFVSTAPASSGGIDASGYAFDFQIKSGSCTTDTAWTDALNYDCEAYTNSPDWCATAFSSANSAGVDATEACCICNGNQSDTGNYSPDDGSSEGSSEGTTTGTTDGVSDGSSEGTTTGNTDGVSDGASEGASEGTTTGTTDGVSDGASEGTTTGNTDGVSDGTGEGNTTGTSDGETTGTTDGTGDEATTGETTGTTDGVADGAADGETDGMSSIDAGNTNGTSNHSSTADAGMTSEDPCDHYECDEGYECTVEWGDCWNEFNDAGLLDGGAEVCLDDLVYCSAIGDAGTLAETSDAGLALEAHDAGLHADPNDAGNVPPTVDAGSENEEVEEDEDENSNIGFINGADDDDKNPPAVDCSCRTTGQSTRGAPWLLVSLLFVSWRMRRE